MKTTLDIAALAQTIVWPIAIAALAIAYRASILDLTRTLAGRVKSVSLAGIDIALSEATQIPVPTAGGLVDLRHAGRSFDVNDSTLATFYEQVRDPSQMDYAVVDLAQGHAWLSSRLYIMAVILRRMRSVKTIVFVETAGDIRRRFLGTCDCEQVRWQLASRYPWLEAAHAFAEARTWLGAFPASEADPFGAHVQTSLPWGLHIANDDGRLVGQGDNPGPAADLLRKFLDGIQAKGAPASTSWEGLPSAAPADPVCEHAVWLTGEVTEDVFTGVLQTSSVPLRDLRGKPASEKTRLIVDQPDRWVAIVRDGGVFDRLIDRRLVLEEVARQAVVS